MFENTLDADSLILDFYAATLTIILTNPTDMKGFDLSKISIYTWFVGDNRVERGTFYVIKDKALKKDIIRFALEKPEKTWKGQAED